MLALIWAYCGICLYFSKASAHWASVIGGIAPIMGFHSVIDRPEPVSRVMPPMTTIRKTMAALANSQIAMA